MNRVIDELKETVYKEREQDRLEKQAYNLGVVNKQIKKTLYNDKDVVVIEETILAEVHRQSICEIIAVAKEFAEENNLPYYKGKRCIYFYIGEDKGVSNDDMKLLWKKAVREDNIVSIVVFGSFVALILYIMKLSGRFF